MSSAERPLNFLIFVVDAMRASWLACARHPLVNTPHLDALAAEGVRFDRAYCNHTSCVPARATLLTGMMPRDHGAWANGIEMHERILTLPQILAAGGYRTGAIGKLHYSRYIPDRRQDDTLSESLPDWNEGNVTEIPLPYYGFEQVDFVGGHGAGVFGPYLEWLARQAPGGRQLMQIDSALETPSGSAYCWKMALPADLHYNRWIADRARDFISPGHEQAKPWFLWCSFPDPHIPYAPPLPYCDLYDPAAIPPPVRSATEFDELPSFYRAICEGAMHYDGFVRDQPDSAWAETTALSLGMVTHVDAEIGRVMEMLEASGQRENTVVMLLSDHGSDMLGDHGMSSFGFSFEQCARIPFIVSVPGGRRGGVYRSPVSQIDLMPTVLELAGLSHPDQELMRDPPPGRHYGQSSPVRPLPGRSLTSKLFGEIDRDETDTVLIEIEEPFLGASSRTLVEQRYKITLYAHQEYGEFFDLENDPEELHNLWNDPAAQQLKLEMTSKLFYKDLEMFAWQPLPISNA